jgi:2-polyprenyl-3-methyl-5-hydroxy-6-metoxy-1,4-benzoquinol methylase
MRERVNGAVPVDPAHPDRYPTPKSYNEMPTCPICREADLRELLSRGSWVYYTCRTCTHRFASVPREEAQELDTLYHDEYAGFREDPVFQRAIRELIRERFLPRFPPGSRVLDVGCGNGEFLAAAAEAGYVVAGIDISPAAAELCRTRGFNAVAGDFLHTAFPEPFDVITMWDVVEHLTEPAAFLSRALELLRPDGYLVMKTPAVSEEIFWMVGKAPFLAGAVLHVDHVQFFSPESFGRLGSDMGFASVEHLRLGDVRGKRPARSVRKQIVRALVRGINRFGGHYNHYVWMRAPAAHSTAPAS